MSATELFFMTNRAPDDPDRPTDFLDRAEGRVGAFRVGRAAVPGSELYRRELAEVTDGVSVETFADDPDMSDAATGRYGTPALLADLRETARANAAAPGEVLILVHGYDFNFRNSLARAAQVAQWYAGRTVLALCWPAQDGALSLDSYAAHRDAAVASGPALGAFLRRLADAVAAEPGAWQDIRLHVMAHSMGAFATVQAMQKLAAIDDGTPARLFDQALLAAADCDSAALAGRDSLGRLAAMSRRVTVYYNEMDLALTAADRIVGLSDRLGAVPPPADVPLPGNVALVNCSAAAIGTHDTEYPAWQQDVTHHQYYRNNPHVRHDALAVLAGTPGDMLDHRKSRGRYERLDRDAGPQPEPGPPHAGAPGR